MGQSDARFVDAFRSCYDTRCFIFFFFSSRRRHTRLQGDWSSDVCSSDLPSGRSPRTSSSWSRSDSSATTSSSRRARSSRRPGGRSGTPSAASSPPRSSNLTMTREIGAVVLGLAVAALALREALGLPIGTVRNPGEGFFPLWLAVLLVALSVLLLRHALRARAAAGARGDTRIGQGIGLVAALAVYTARLR